MTRSTTSAGQALPTGTVTFLFTDIEGSTKLAQEYPDRWEALRERHHAILQTAIDSHNGYVFQIIGDAFCAAFHTALNALNAAIAAQQHLQQAAWSPARIKVRIGISTGTAQVGNSDDRSGGYRGYATMARVQRVMAAGHGGQILISNSSYELLGGELPRYVSLRDMGEHRLQGLLNPEHLWQVTVPDLQQDFAPLRSLNKIPSNLPAQLTSFVGREQQIEEVKQELEARRLVTLTGAGGTGKTRLSLQIAAEVLDHYPDGVWFIELAPLADPELIPRTILSAMGLSEQPGKTPIEVLKENLREKKALIILDNCEHLVSASAQVANTLLHAAPKLTVLASSREALGVKGELSYPVPSLSSPNPKQIPTPEQLSQYEAVRLFIDRALLVAPHFVVEKDNAPHMAQICYRLDGIPLAIELAAARVKMLTVGQISQRLDDRFRLLTGGARTALPRQQTLRALIDWSYAILSDDERSLLSRLSVFAGGWTLEAAEKVCSGEGIEPDDVLDLLTQLVNKSLVVVSDHSHGWEKHYRLLETIRQYAREKLLESSQGEELHDRHFDHYLQMVKRAHSEYFSPKEMVWLVWLENEWDNLRSAVEWSSEKCPDGALELVNNLGDLFLDNLNNACEMDNWLTQLLAHAQNSTRTLRRARGLCHWAWYASFSREEEFSSESLIEEGLSICTELDDKNGLAHGYLTKVLADDGLGDTSRLYEQAVGLYREAQNKLGLAHTWHYYGYLLPPSETERKLAYMEESLSIRRELGYTTGIIESLKQLGALHIRRGDFKSAQRMLNEGASILHAHVSVLGNSITIAYDLGDLAFFQGDYDLAQKHYEDALAWSNQKGLPWALDWAKVRLGYLFLQKSELENADSYFHQVLTSFQKNGNKAGVMYSLEGFAGLAIARQHWERAIRLLGSATMQRDQSNFQRAPVEQTVIEHSLAIIHANLDDVTFEKVWNEGSGLTLEQAVSLALADRQ